MGPALILLFITAGLWAAGFGLAGRLLSRPLRKGSAAPRSVSVIIPARNEEHNLPRLLRSLTGSSLAPLEIIVVDDGSADRTAQVARELGAKVLASPALPPGWRGKTWACYQGAKAANGEWLVFVDADTWFEPGGLEKALSACPGGAFSAGPYHVVERPYEQLSLFFNLNMVAGTVPDRLFGQMLVVDRQSYWRVGGHEAVRGRILENFWLGTRFRAAGVGVGSVAGRGILSFRMYPNGLRELLQGWTKGFASGAGKTPPGVLLLIVGWMTGLMLAPLGGLISGDWIPWGTIYLLCAGQVRWFSRQIGAFRWYAAAFYPAALVFFFILFAWSALRSGRKVRWKGREILAD